jgi:hypothetical protein
MTKQVELKPLDEEYILMGMSAYGNRNTDRVNFFKNLFIENEWDLDFKQNFHIGQQTDKLNDWHKWDIAAATQCLTENLVCNVMRRARNFNWSENLVYMGGVALNCVVNSKLFNYFNDVWIMPNPGDAGSSLGAAALAYGKKLNWQNAYLGHNIAGSYPVTGLLDELLTNKIVGVANGKAEFIYLSMCLFPQHCDIQDSKTKILKSNLLLFQVSHLVKLESLRLHIEQPTSAYFQEISQLFVYLKVYFYPNKLHLLASQNQLKNQLKKLCQ